MIRLAWEWPQWVPAVRVRKTTFKRVPYQGESVISERKEAAWTKRKQTETLTTSIGCMCMGSLYKGRSMCRKAKSNKRKNPMIFCLPLSRFMPDTLIAIEVELC